jgi:argininosuccinate synthase
MRNLDIADSRDKLEQYASLSEVLLGRSSLFGDLELDRLELGGGAEQIAENPAAGDESVLEAAAIEEGVD